MFVRPPLVGFLAPPLAISKEVGIEKIIAEAKPEQKAEMVKELQVSYFMSLSLSYIK